MLQGVMETLLIQSLAGGGLVLVMMLIRRLCAGRISAQLIYALWLVVALRFLVPLELPGIPWARPEGDEAVPLREMQVCVVELPAASSNVAPDRAAAAADGPAPERYDVPAEDTSARVEAEHGATRSADTAWQCAFAIWLLGVAAVSAYMICTNRRFACGLALSAARLDVPGALPVYCAEVDTPCVAGLFRPRIYVNAAATAPGLLPYVIAHETMHVRAHDNCWLLLRNVVCALYWFQPLAWVAAALATRDCEHACDARVTRRYTGRETIEYARALVCLSCAKATRFAVASEMVSSKAALRQRVERILHAPERKRWLCCAVALLLVSVSALSCATGEVVGARVDAPERFAVLPEYSVIGGDMAVLADGKLYRSTGEELALLGEYPEAEAVAYTAQGIYICAHHPQGDLLERLDGDGSSAESFRLPAGMRVQSMHSAGEGILLVVAPADVPASQTEAYMFDAQHGTVRRLTRTPYIDICADGSSVYVLHENADVFQWSISRVVDDAGGVEEVCQVEPDSLRSMAVCPDGVYYCDNRGNIEYMRFADGQSERIADADIYGVDSFERIQYQRDCVYAFGYDGDADDWRLFRFDVTALDAGNVRTLTIANLDSDGARESYMTRWFNAQYPSVKLSNITLDVTGLATRLMAGDADIDIVYGNAGYVGQYALSGAYRPLDDMAGLHDAMRASGFLDYRPAMTYDGRLYGVPDQVWFYGVELNEPLLESLDISWPSAPYSWAELADWAIAALSGTEYRLLAYAVIDPARQYIDMALQTSGEVVLDTPEFRQSMEAYRRLVQAGLIQLDANTRQLDNALAAVSSLYMGAYAPLPTLAGQTASIADVYGFYVPAGTADLELVEAYLTEYVSAECQYSCEYGYPYYMLLQDTDGYERAWMDAAILRGSFDYRDATEQLRVSGYDDIVLNGRNYRLHGALERQTELRAYLEARIDLDEYIRRIQPRLDVMQYE